MWTMDMIACFPVNEQIWGSLCWIFTTYLMILTSWIDFKVWINHRLVETHIFSFVVGRAFVADIEKLKISSKTRSLDVVKVLKFFSEGTKVCLMSVSECWLFSLWLLFWTHVMHTSLQDGISHGSNLLTAVEILVSGVDFLNLQYI